MVPWAISSPNETKGFGIENLNVDPAPTSNITQLARANYTRSIDLPTMILNAFIGAATTASGGTSASPSDSIWAIHSQPRETVAKKSQLGCKLRGDLLIGNVI